MCQSCGQKLFENKRNPLSKHKPPLLPLFFGRRSLPLLRQQELSMVLVIFVTFYFIHFLVNSEVELLLSTNQFLYFQAVCLVLNLK